ncbi:intraflagellar transport protein 88 homolog [Dysidea avara]|uniref:intraflagellar transport protein 88 homolog n=1 Tax=Dysidea avara TaxID=196820 RepID=UPI003317B963
MENLRLAPDNDEDDLYSGYDYQDNLLDDLEDDQGLQQAIKTSYGQRPSIPMAAAAGPPGTGFRMGTGRLMTGFVTESGHNRPMTSVKGAGYTSAGRKLFDPLNQTSGGSSDKTGGATGSGAILETKQEDGVEEVIKQLEKKVNQLLEESAVANCERKYQLALDRAKEAGRKERLLCKQRDQASLNEQINLDLTYSVLFNLANQYHANKMYSEALNTYLLIVKNKMFTNGGRLRVNMGNIYFEQKKYPQAVKMYRMALDQIQNVHKDVRLKILQNIGAVFVRMGQYSDAMTSYEHIMSEKPSVKAAFNLILCYHAIGDQEKLKRGFQRLLKVQQNGEDDEDRYYPTVDDDQQQRLLIEVIKDDELRKIETERRQRTEYFILTSAKLISPVIESSFAAGFDWCIECVKSSPYTELASELEMAKALTYLKQRDFAKAVDTLKGFEKKDSKMAATASTNLSFLYYLEGDLKQAEKYADLAMSTDRYNPCALVNKGNCLFTSGQYEKASECYQEALSIEATCSEALHNLALCHKRMNQLPEALDHFTKLHSIIRNSPHVIYQIADIYDKLEDYDQSSDWFMQLLSLVPTDPNVLQRLGDMYEDSDKSQSFQYYLESYRYCPSNIEVISWLGAYYMDSQYADKAIQFFERASLIQPKEISWRLMIASCYRKTGNYPQAFQTYKQAHQIFPDNIECLKFLVRLCTDLGLKDAQEYIQKLKKAEKARETKQQRELSGGRRHSGKATSDSGSRRSSAASSSAAHRIDSGSHLSARERITSADSDAAQSSDSAGIARKREADHSYVDPLGELPERPKTAARQKPADEDEFHDTELGEDLLPE